MAEISIGGGRAFFDGSNLVRFCRMAITSVVKDRKVSGDEKSRTRDGDDAAISA